MKPKTEFEKRIVALSKRLPGLSKAQVTYLKEDMFEHGATLLKSGKLSCLDCGHQWVDKGAYLAGVILGEECPNCHRQLKVHRTRKKVFYAETYYQVISVFQGHQVIRLFKTRKRHKAGEPQNFYVEKLYENWFSEDGERGIVGQFQTSKWNDCWGGGYELRSKEAQSDYRIGVKEKSTYPRKRLLKVLQRNGLTKDFQDCNPVMLVDVLLNNSKAETLLKAKQYHLLDKMIYRPEHVDEHWSSIKICLRNKYYVAEPTEWMDYLRLLKEFGKDIRNPKYICPKNMMLQHNKYVEKKRKLRMKQDIEQRRQELDKAQKQYAKTKKPYMGLVFSNGVIAVSFMNSVEEVMEDADALRHCSFSNKYYEKRTLLFSAKIEEKRIATVEIDPQNYKVLQVRGYHNKPTNYDMQITSLVKQNMSKIAERIKPKRKARAKKKLMVA